MTGAPLLLSAVLLLSPVLPIAAQGERGARRTEEPQDGLVKYDPAQSAALFVGVRRFTHDRTLTEVRYAVDDAIDLAYTISIEQSKLVNPLRVTLALSGEPEKPQSHARLRRLIEEGATVIPATQSDILAALENQAHTAGPAGLLLLSFATHGFARGGVPHLLAASSILKFPSTAISASEVADIASRSDATRSLILIDACRERLTTDARAGSGDRLAAAPLIDAMSRVAGQSVIYAAAAGRYAYDDDETKNGVFTAAILDGLHCRAASDSSGLVTVETLAKFAEDRVRAWIQKYRDPTVRTAIQWTADEGSRSMPLVHCGPARKMEKSLTATAMASLRPARVTREGEFITVYADDGTRLWGRGLSGTIAYADVADLDGDGTNEVLAGVGSGGDDSGKVVAFNATGNRRWEASTSAPFNYDGGHGGRMAIRTFATADLFGTGKRQVVALSLDQQGWYQSRLSVFDTDGRLLAGYWHPGHLHQIAIAAETPGQPPRIVVAGVNNDLQLALSPNVAGYVACVFMLDPHNISGEAPPFFGKLGKGSQMWYGVVLPAKQNVQRLEIIDQNNDGRRDISIWTDSGHVFYVDFAGRMIAHQRSDGATGDAQFGLLATR